jgi:lipopolysaccharide biosynthesis glycosyltransferase
LAKPKIIHYVGRQKPWFTNDLYYEWFKYKSNNL